MEYVGAIIELFKCRGPPLGKYVEYHKKLDENMSKLKRKLEELNSQKKDVEEMLRTEHSLGKSPLSEVNNWLRNTEMINGEVEQLEKEVNRRKSLSRARLSKLAEEKIQEVKDYRQKGRSFKCLVIDTPPARGMTLPAAKLAGENTQKILEEIWEYLMGNEVSKIGVWGLGGVGKTTIITHINNRLLQNKDKFDHVIWVTVSQPFDLIKLQDHIASMFNKVLRETEDQEIRAGEVFRLFQGKKFVLILDDMWEAFPLEDVGILEPTKENGCKLMITTRSQDVCRSMGCKEVYVQPLSKDEALKLFLEKLELDISQVPTLKEVVQLVAEQCAGLPLAIITIAGCMKRIDDLREWRNALNELCNHIRSAKDLPVIARLQFSYDRLKDEMEKRCFLYCALYPEDFKIPKDELIDYWIMEGLTGERDNLQAEYDWGHSVLNRLVNNCLLESAENGSCVKMHDLVREMALHITSKSPLFMTKADLKLKKIPSEREWKENLEKASLMMNYIQEIPSNMSPNCHDLSTLLLRGNPLKSIPESFFIYMEGLKILDLSRTNMKDLPNSISELRNLRALLLQHNNSLQSIPDSFFLNMEGLKVLDLSSTFIEVLPRSISDLRNLTTLLLNGCFRLKHVPCLAKLLCLQNLGLEDTGVKEVPEGMEMLENLRYLNLCSWNLDKLPAGMLSRLCHLQKLSVYLGSGTLGETIEEACRLSELETFVGHFSKLDDYNLYAKSFDDEGPKPKSYHHLVGPRTREFLIFPLPSFDPNKCLTLSHLVAEGYAVVPKDVDFLYIGYCDNIRSLSDVLLFKKVSRDRGLNSMYPDLKVLWMEGNGNLKKLLSPTLLQALPNLELIGVWGCEEIEEIITLDDVDEDEKEEKGKKEGMSNTSTFTFTLPKLRMLYLWNLPKLKSVCSDKGVMVCDSLQEIEVWACPKLKRLPLSLPLRDNGQPSPPPAIKKIEIKRELWESLEWDDPNAKDVLQPYCQFCEL